MAKAIISLGYTIYVVEPDVAMQIANTLVDAEQFEQHGYGESATLHVWKGDNLRGISIQFISDDAYRIGKLAGKRVKDQ